MYDFQKNALLQSFKAQSYAIEQIGLSPDGQKIFTRSHENFRVYDLRTANHLLMKWVPEMPAVPDSPWTGHNSILVPHDMGMQAQGIYQEVDVRTGNLLETHELGKPDRPLQAILPDAFLVSGETSIQLIDRKTHQVKEIFTTDINQGFEDRRLVEHVFVTARPDLLLVVLHNLEQPQKHFTALMDKDTGSIVKVLSTTLTPVHGASTSLTPEGHLLVALMVDEVGIQVLQVD